LTIWIDKNNFVWTGILNNGIWCYNGSGWKQINITAPGIAKNNIIMMAQDFEKQYLFLSQTDTLLVYNGTDWKKENNASGESLKKIFRAYVNQAHLRYVPS